MVKIAIDAMGGDYAPKSIVDGCLKAMREDADIYLFLVGDEAKVRECLSGQQFSAFAVCEFVIDPHDICFAHQLKILGIYYGIKVITHRMII